jgi:hypothetical protein
MRPTGRCDPKRRSRVTVEVEAIRCDAVRVDSRTGKRVECKYPATGTVMYRYLSPSDPTSGSMNVCDRHNKAVSKQAFMAYSMKFATDKERD